MKKSNSIILICFGILALILFLYNIESHLSLETLKTHKELLKQFVSQHYITSVLIYITAYFASVVLVFPIAALTNVAGGYLFGTFAGTLYTSIGGTAGAISLFLLIRYLLGKQVEKRYPEQIRSIKQELKKDTISFLLFLRLVALFPFFLINILLGLVPISLWTFTWTTLVGTLPSFLVYAYAGKQLTMLQSLQDIFTPSIVIIFILLGCISLLPIAVRRLYLSA